VIERTNEEWLQALTSTGSARVAALNDLRDVLVRGLRRGLLGRVNTSAPDFDALAEDFVQEALLKILDNLPTFAGRSKFTTWAHKITVHVALSELRRKRWQDASLTALSEPDEGPYVPGLTADPAPNPASLAERRDMLARVNRIITETLSDKQRAALSATVIQGLPTAQVAEMLQVNPNALYKLVHDARRQLKKQLLAEGLAPTDVLEVFE
jgi:RNA polymerase sigma-70 factor, ECF subfamily